MDRIYTYGPTSIKLYSSSGIAYRITLLSRRGAAMALKKSRDDKWAHQIVEYSRWWKVTDGFLIVGFQPDSGHHIACWADPTEKIT